MQFWKDWFDMEAPEDSPIPDGYTTSLNTFHKLLLIRSWCPDRTIPMAKIYVAEVMGKQVGFIDVFVLAAGTLYSHMSQLQCGRRSLFEQLVR